MNLPLPAREADPASSWGFGGGVEIVGVEAARSPERVADD